MHENQQKRNKETPSVQPPDKTVVSCSHIFAKSQHLLLVWTAGMYHAYRLHRWQTNRSCRPVQVMLTTFLFQIFHTHLSPNQMPSQIFRACMARSSVRFGLHTVYNAILKCWHPTHLTNLLEAIHYLSLKTSKAQLMDVTTIFTEAKRNTSMAVGLWTKNSRGSTSYAHLKHARYHSEGQC